jgi:hypothetical protein
LSKVSNWEKFPTEIKYLLPHDQEKTRKAASAAIKEVTRKKEEILGRETLVEEEDCDGQRPSKKFKKNSGLTSGRKEEIEDIFENLRKNLVFDMGFCVKGLKPSDEMNCWCPWFVIITQRIMNMAACFVTLYKVLVLPSFDTTRGK